MSEEKRKVLEMLEAGKITQEDALRLLEALGEKGGAEEKLQPAPKKEEPGVEASFRSAMREVRDEAGAALREAGQALSEVAEEAAAAMQGAKKAVPSLTLWPETPMGEPLEAPKTPSAPSAPSSAPAAHPCQESPEYRPLPVEGMPYMYPGMSPEVESIDIEWISGPVEIRPWDGATINVSEYAKRPLDEGQQLELTVAGGVMRIRWARERAFWRNMFGRSKHLVVEVPRELAAGLGGLRVKNVSGSVSVVGVNGTEFALNSTSGAVSAYDVKAETLKLISVSGGIRAEQAAAVEMVLNSTSGSVRAEHFAAERIKLNSVSGSLKASGGAEAIDANSTSGSVSVWLEQCPKEAALNSVSGRLSLSVPENDGFTVQYNSVSGSFNTDFPVTGNLGKKSGRAVYASGSAHFKLTTMSGGIEVHRI